MRVCGVYLGHIAPELVVIEGKLKITCGRNLVPLYLGPSCRSCCRQCNFLNVDGFKRTKNKNAFTYSSSLAPACPALGANP